MPLRMVKLVDEYHLKLNALSEHEVLWGRDSETTLYNVFEPTFIASGLQAVLCLSFICHKRGADSKVAWAYFPTFGHRGQRLSGGHLVSHNAKQGKSSALDVLATITDELYPIDILIRDADNDSWETGSGGSRARAFVTFEPGGPVIDCRRARSVCKGAHACELIDPALRTAVRFELNPTSRETVLAAQADTRRNEGTTPEQQALKEQLKASKQVSKSGSSTILSASSSGRVKMAPARSAVPAPVCSMQSENATLYPGAVHPAELLSGFTPPQQAAEFASYDLFTFGALTGVPAPEFSNMPTMVPADFSGIDFSTFDIDAFFGLDPNFNTSIPLDPPAEYLQQDYMHSFTPSVPADLEYLDNLPSPSMALAFNPVPFLLLLHLSLPHLPANGKFVGARAPTARKRMAAEMTTSDRSEKRAKAKV
ncbi:hypothetical protein B0H17DRAFT_1148816 [Mycena rosella]|uniref:Uncharacterized protein n=1 Tax=Mycena rosella TaxID=1033263 RepID=A0AAD7FWB9_MYCRO|nr:hypothetical protein B0H17DRAFT_1148816 [Mycena rosella]